MLVAFSSIFIVSLGRLEWAIPFSIRGIFRVVQFVSLSVNFPGIKWAVV